MQYKTSLLAVLSLSATSFAAPKASVPELPVAGAVGALSPLPIRDAPNLASPFSPSNGDIIKRQVGGLASISKVATPVTAPVTDLVSPTLKRNTITVTEVQSCIQEVKISVVSNVSSIHSIITSVGYTAAGQQGLVEEIVEDLGCIVAALTVAVEGVLAYTVPTVVVIAAEEVDVVHALINDVEVVVFQIVHVLAGLVGGLLDSTLQLVQADLIQVYKLLKPLLTPILSFVGVVQCDIDVGLIQEIAAAVSGILGSCNGLLSVEGLIEIDL